jgi:pyruvate,water dikinase
VSNTDIPDVVWLTDPEAVDTGLVGGKGANLAVLTQASFPVPPGFCVTTGAYVSFLESGRLNSELLRLAGKLEYDNADQMDEVTGRIRDLISTTDMPVGLVAAIEQSYGQIGAECYVAVRSSGTAEDLADASFAGLHDTFLDVRGAKQVVEAVRSCWASMWTARATLYRHSKGLDHAAVAISVVVQQMVDSEISGVVFTGNPLTTATDEMVINASFGLGEAIVQGLVTPDEYTVKTATMKVIGRYPGHQGGADGPRPRDGDRNGDRAGRGTVADNLRPH